MSKIIIVGSGVVGSATGKGLAKAGHEVTFVDVDPARLEALREEGHEATDGLELTDEPSFIFLTLPTPNDGYRWDLGPFAAGTRTVGEALRDSDGHHTVVIRSTVPPGTTEGLVQPLLEQASEKCAGRDFALASNPEFLRAAFSEEDFLNPWMTVIASRSRRTVARLVELLEPFGGEVRTFSDPKTAELIKAAHNLYNATKISFWNELWQVSDRLGVDADAVATTVSRSAEGSINPDYGIRGGAPYGGACLPKDTKGFLGFARELGLDMPVLTGVDETNEQMRALVGVRGDDDRERDDVATRQLELSLSGRSS
jgi:UDPglucose 6-dehydrogenase